MIGKSKIVVTCGKGGVEILSHEIHQLDYKVLEVNHLDVVIEGTLLDCMFLNMHLRTAHRVFLLIDSFEVSNPDQLYKKVNQIPWEKHLNPDGYICITNHVFNDFIQDTRFANLRVKDAIADRMTSKFGRRPDSGPERSNTVIFLHWVKNIASIYFDTSGETIAKHNYRKLPFKAPLKESLAASLIMNTKWHPGEHFINPMCGSGTLAIEAALIELNIAPGLSRKNYGFMHLNHYDPEQWQKIRKNAHGKIRSRLKGEIIANDNSNLALKAAKANAELAEVHDLIKFELGDFNDTSMPQGQGVVIFNPAYGERLGDTEQLKLTYPAIGDFFKKKCEGKTGYIFTGNTNLAKSVGLRTKRKIPYFNGKIECRLLEYELYQGTRKERPVNKT